MQGQHRQANLVTGVICRGSAQQQATKAGIWSGGLHASAEMLKDRIGCSNIYDKVRKHVSANERTAFELPSCI
jgi:hypothetical protein